MAPGPVQADWFIDLDTEGEDEDPFDVVQEGLAIEIGDEVARISKALVKTVEKEGGLYKQGITCAIKDREDTSCWACPVYEGHDKSSALGILCRVGREQERLSTRMAVISEEKKEAVPA